MIDSENDICYVSGIATFILFCMVYGLFGLFWFTIGLCTLFYFVMSVSWIIYERKKK